MENKTRWQQAVINLMKNPNLMFVSTSLLKYNIRTSGKDDSFYTDGEAIYIASNVEEFEVDEIEFIVAHEMFHIVLDHIGRLANKKINVFNIATDIVINEVLLQIGLRLPRKIRPLLDEKKEFVNMSSEEIYRKIMDDSNNDDNNNDGNGNGSGTDGKKSFKEQLDEMFDQTKLGGIKSPESGEQSNTSKAIAGSLRKEIKSSRLWGKLPGRMKESICEIDEPKVNWRELLRHYMVNRISGDLYNDWSRRNKRYREVYLPKAYDDTVGDFSIIIDTSGSISQNELNVFMSEVKGILDEFEIDEEIQIIMVDTLASDNYVSPDDLLNLTIKGGGGTDFAPGYDILNPESTFVIYFTDGYSNSFPDPSKQVDTLWCIYNGDKGFDPPFGEVAFIEEL